jgi:putative transposase
MSDCLEDGRKFRSLNIIDQYNQICLGIYNDFSLPSMKVIECLERVFSIYGVPKAIRTDNGPEFISNLFTLWLASKGIEYILVQPDKPAKMQSLSA